MILGKIILSTTHINSILKSIQSHRLGMSLTGFLKNYKKFRLWSAGVNLDLVDFLISEFNSKLKYL